MNFAAIDFETANRFHGSVCALGLVIVEQGQIVKKISKLVRPKELFFEYYNVKIHGITEEQVKNELEFNELWPEILPLLEGRIILAHNASFDMSVLRNVLLQYDLPCPSFSHACTVKIARKTWPELMSHRLNSVAEHLGIEFQHHDALEDAIACAKIAVRACELHKVHTVQGLAEKLQIKISSIDSQKPLSFKPYFWNFRYPAPGDVVPDCHDFDPEHPFYCSSCVFTGHLKTMTRKEAMQKVVNCGGQCSNTVNKGTKYLIIGEQDYRVKDGKSSKFKKAEQLIREGLEIEILNEEQFLKFLDAKSIEAI